MAKNTQNVRETMEQMYAERDEMGDVAFLVESHRIRAHRIVLATLSPKYKAQFFGPHRDEGEIRVQIASAAAFEVFLQFFYKETVDLTMDNIEMVLDLAKQSLVDKFVECCASFLQDAVKANNICVPYRLANLYDIESLRLECEQRISTKTMDIFASDDFICCDRDTLLQILKMDTLNCNEHYVFAACIEWARAQCKRDNLDDGKSENLRAALGDAIYQVRFSSLNLEEFAVLHKSMEGLFTIDESIELLYITAKLKDFKSQKFNQTVRTLSWSLELNRFVHMRKLMEEIDVTKNSHFSFTCNKPIRLHGIALGIHFSALELENFPKTLYFYDNEWEWDPCVLNCNVYQSPIRYNETMIIFEKPIERIKFFSSSIRLPFKGLNYEFDLHHTARGSDIVLKFKGGKWVMRLFFDKYD